MSQTPFDQDRPQRRTRPARDARPRSGDRPDRSRSDAPRRRRPDGDGESNGGATTEGLAGLPRWAVPVGIGVVSLLMILVVVRACSGGGSRSDAGSCLTDLADHLPATATAVYGTDFVQASKAGWPTDGSLEEIGVALEETGVIPDPVTVEYRISRLATTEQFAARTGMAPGDVECALGEPGRAVLSGSFDPPAVNGSQAGSDGNLAATDDLLAMDTGQDDPEALLEEAEAPLSDVEPVMDVVESLRDAGAYSVILQQGDGEDGRALAAGVGAGGDGDQRTVLLAWSFDDEDAAKAGRPNVVNRVNSVLKGTLSITAADLMVDGSMVTASLPTQSAAPLQDLQLSGARLVDAPDE